MAVWRKAIGLSAVIASCQAVIPRTMSDTTHTQRPSFTSSSAATCYIVPQWRKVPADIHRQLSHHNCQSPWQFVIPWYQVWHKLHLPASSFMCSIFVSRSEMCFWTKLPINNGNIWQAIKCRSIASFRAKGWIISSGYLLSKYCAKSKNIFPLIIIFCLGPKYLSLSKKYFVGSQIWVCLKFDKDMSPFEN